MTMLFNISLVAFLVSLVIGAIALFVKRRMLELLANVLLAGGAVALTSYIVIRWVEAGRAPFSNMFESLVLFSWTVAVVYLVLRIRVKIPVLGALSELLALLTLAYASAFTSADIKPLMPALQSNWLTVHVFTCFLGYAGFAVAFLASVCYLAGNRMSTEGRLEILDITIAKTISFGFLFLSIGIITGSVWANSAWGTYWSWDPKETWSLITWFVYAIFLHCRFMRGWRGKKTAWISVIGFLAVLFTYFGVNYLLSGLHSYA